MLALINNVLQVPIIIASFEETFAAITISTDYGNRGIVANKKLLYKNILAWRFALAHEICHVLFDTTQNLKSLRISKTSKVFDYDDTDYVEKRANAFAAELLLPKAAIKRIFINQDDIVSYISNYGIGIKATKSHLKNRGLKDFNEIYVGKKIDISRWTAKELDQTSSFNNIIPLRILYLAKEVISSEKKGIISKQNALNILSISEEEYEICKQKIAST